MHKHRGFPSRLTGSDFHFLIRREGKKGATKLEARERFRDRRPPDKRADEGFLAAMIDCFGEETFVRGNLDAGRLSWFIGREVKPVGEFNPTDYEQELELDFDLIAKTFPKLVAVAEEEAPRGSVFYDLEAGDADDDFEDYGEDEDDPDSADKKE